jgi:hypothetical protein
VSGARYLCVHAHFYQPPRHEPSNGCVPREPGAAPFHDWNQRISHECYRPNAERGNFEQINFDVGPTLAAWLDEREPDVMARIVAAEAAHRRAFGVSNAMAQNYGHTILPLATDAEKRLQVAWGLADYRHRFGHPPAGFWLAEAAVDLATLRVLQESGVEFTLLAPWQAAGPFELGEASWIELGGGRRIAAFFYNAALSEHISQRDHATSDADQFAATFLSRALSREKEARDERQMVILATDGELYGHHKPRRDQFLARLVHGAAASAGFHVTSLAAYLREHPPRRATPVREGSSWSCCHQLARWNVGCLCTCSESGWKVLLRQTLRRVADEVDDVYFRLAKRLVDDPWTTLLEYINVPLGAEALSGLLRRHRLARVPGAASTMHRLLDSQYHRQLMFASCGWFHDSPDRIEPHNNVRYAEWAIQGLPGPDRARIEPAFRDDLARVWRSDATPDATPIVPR